MPKINHRVKVALLVAVTALAVASCSSDNGNASDGASSSASSATVEAAHNAADVLFAQEMVQHHQGAVEMAQMAQSRAVNADVTALAKKIEDEQGPEITSMTEWLQAWGEPLPSNSMPDGESMEGMSHSDASGSPSMASEMDGQVTQLEEASGADFDKTFLRMMIEHHQTAVDMAHTEQVDGSNPQAVTLARQIVKSQTAQISQMKEMLAKLA